MASSPRVVAELGRPETAQESADRKAASSHAYRSSKTFKNLLAALLVTVAVVAVVVLGVPRGSVPDAEPVDIAAAADAAAAAQGGTVVTLEVPDGWLVNDAATVGGTWRIVLAPEEGFIRVAQRFDAEDGWVSSTLAGRAPTGTRTIEGIEWDVYEVPASAEDAGNITYALATEAGDDAVLVYGRTDAETAADVAAAIADDVETLQEETP